MCRVLHTFFSVYILGIGVRNVGLCVFDSFRGMDGGKERERDTDRQKERETEREGGRKRERQIETERERETDRQTERDTERERGRERQAGLLPPPGSGLSEH